MVAILSWPPRVNTFPSQLKFDRNFVSYQFQCWIWCCYEFLLIPLQHNMTFFRQHFQMHFSGENDWILIEIQCSYYIVNFLRNSHNGHPISRPWEKYGVSFASSKSDLCSATRIAILWVISWRNVCCNDIMTPDCITEICSWGTNWHQFNISSGKRNSHQFYGTAIIYKLLPQ